MLQELMYLQRGLCQMIIALFTSKFTTFRDTREEFIPEKVLKRWSRGVLASGVKEVSPR